MRSIHVVTASCLLLTLAPFALATLAGCDDDLLFPIVEPLETEPSVTCEPPPNPVHTCETVSTGESDVTPQVLLVIDRSGSMTDGAPGFLGTRWSAVADAVTSMTAAHQSKLGFGLMMFPSPRSGNACAPGIVIIEPALATAQDIADEVGSTGPSGSTPTAATLRAARAFLEERDVDAPVAVILATDGGPNCNAALNVATCGCVMPGACDDANAAPPEDICLDDAETVAAADELHEAGVATYVIGIPGSEDYADVLDELATAGGTARSPDAGAERYYPTTDAASLADALEAVPARLEKCQRVVPLDDGRTLTDAESIEVRLDGVPLARDPYRAEGWELTGQSRIELYGAACDQAVAGATVDVDVCHIVPGEIGGA